MPGQRREIEKKLGELPDNFSADEIIRMYDKLKRDVAVLISRNTPVSTMEGLLHKRHNKLAISYPTIFFKTVRGELDPRMFHVMMSLKKKVDEGEMTNEDAKKSVIDGAKAHIEKLNASGTRKIKEIAPGSSVKEINLKCKLEDEDDENNK